MRSNTDEITGSRENLYGRIYVKKRYFNDFSIRKILYVGEILICGKYYVLLISGGEIKKQESP